MFVDDVGIAYAGPASSPSSSLSMIPSPLPTTSPAEEARGILALENEVLGPDGLPFAPMMTYQKYLTMQVSTYGVGISLSLDGFLSGNKKWRGGAGGNNDDAHHTGSNVP
jgi:hypothetical protein